MVTDGHLLPPIEQVTSAYEASFDNDGQQVLSTTLTSFTPKLRKCILEYNVASMNPFGERVEEAVIGKVYSRTETGNDCYHLMQYVWNHGMDTDPYYTIVRPLAFVSHLRLFLMSKAPGKTLDDYIHTAQDGKQGAYLAANWLARLHSIPPSQIQNNKRTRSGADIGRFVHELETAVPNKSSSFRSIYNRLLVQSGKPWTGQPVFLHGDFHPKNVFLDEERVVAIDFDHHFAGDPAWDVAYLACQIQISGFFKRGDFHYFDPIVRYLVDVYLELHPAYNRTSFVERLCLYRARSLFESLHYELCVLKKGDLHIVDLFLNECEQSLDGKGFH
ncbi:MULTISPECIES: aminoglycoside phosphotransferase family protein [unclassified Paenibacillus]|uniref:phosphotransferase family protein n=1 Tax=unclassified Paenibacillus TaxID=185978 RepID=UPI001AE15B33|nr:MULTISPECIES: aminoglycoside phosphotransferase family protein [unclassified Paenibacillus]MBP1155870.1 hypothetical protein [Paenibacillus sp. PvP091]MBP1168744.1 hypothetical protein [Paenibacillus sp. PvR098]MBP2439772.1 hypothetical protein [Paenibacillus sp. PvP052]